MIIKDKNVLITGAASGIGFGIAQYCLKQGVKTLFLLDADPLAIGTLRQSLGTLTEMTHIVEIDVSDESAVACLAQEWSNNHEPMDIIINCAGVSGPFGAVWEVPAEQVNWTLNTNLKGTVNIARSFIPQMLLNKREPQYFITVSSHLGLVTEAHLFSYQMTKHAIVAFTEALEKDLQQRSASIQLAIFFPFFVKSNLSHSDRHLKLRQQDLYVAPESEAFFKAIQKETDQGIEAIEAAKVLFDGLEAGAFYIFTDKQTKQDFKARVEHIFERSFPK